MLLNSGLDNGCCVVLVLFCLRVVAGYFRFVWVGVIYVYQWVAVFVVLFGTWLSLVFGFLGSVVLGFCWLVGFVANYWLF